jgi:hypothetical protein
MIRSHNGWKASKDAAEIHIISVPIEGTTIKVRCAKAVAPLIAGFCKEFHEPLNPLMKAHSMIGVMRFA